MRIIVFDLASVTRKFFELEKTERLTDGSAFAASIQHITRAADGFDRVVVARDIRPSFRHACCPTYKQGREAPGAVYEKLETDVLTRMAQEGATVFPSSAEARDPRLEIEPGGFPEADDVIASLCAWSRKQRDVEVVIAAEDSDLCALVDDGAGISMRRFDGTPWYEEQVTERFGCRPDMISHAKALGGDEADRYKPFPHPEPPGEDGKTKPGIGLKTAIKLLVDFGAHGDPSLGLKPAERVLLAAQDGHEKGGLPDGHARKCLLAGGAPALAMGYRCATMLEDLPLGFDRILSEPVKRSIVPERKSAPEAVPAPKPAEAAPMVLRQSEALRPRRDRDRIERYALQPRRFEELCAVAEMLYDARVFPQFSTWQGIAGAALVAAEQGIGIGQALRGTYVVEGKLAFSAALIASLVRRSPSCKVLRLLPELCDDMAKPARYTFTIAMAERMKGGRLTGRDPSKPTKWQTQPHLMLCWAALREVCRLWWYDIAAGMYTPDELRAGMDATDEEVAVATVEDIS
jgi:5'-3' exonuclease